MALVIRSHNDITFTHGVSTPAPLGVIDWAKYDPPFFDTFGWRNRKAIVVGAGVGILALVAVAVSAVIK